MRQESEGETEDGTEDDTGEGTEEDDDEDSEEEDELPRLWRLHARMRLKTSRTVRIMKTKLDTEDEHICELKRVIRVRALFVNDSYRLTSHLGNTRHCLLSSLPQYNIQPSDSVSGTFLVL